MTSNNFSKSFNDLISIIDEIFISDFFEYKYPVKIFDKENGDLSIDIIVKESGRELPCLYNIVMPQRVLNTTIARESFIEEQRNQL